MSVTAPTNAQFKDRYPTLASVSDAAINAVLGEAVAQVDENWLAQDIAPAIMAYAAHLLTLEGHGSTVTMPNGMSVQTAGPIDAIQIGDVRTMFAAGVSRAKVAVRAEDGGLRETSFGRRFLELRRRNASPVMVIDG